ncbi:hypothetical protein E2C01_025087 [Portunus trituberculatus]|uniref:Uncharacterized protein n=1 Tax=Portunus trituberculatus TaxID=210409 RepID=A0A5B7EC90_PORTR|nr:hypothetical protein [Portunus trituberculatus]
MVVTVLTQITHILASLADESHSDGDPFAEEDEDKEADHQDDEGDDEQHQPCCLQLSIAAKLLLHLRHVAESSVAGFSECQGRTDEVD